MVAPLQLPLPPPIIQIVFGIHGAAAVEVAKRGNNRQEIFRLEAVGRHTQIRGEFFDVQILSGL